MDTQMCKDYARRRRRNIMAEKAGRTSLRRCGGGTSHTRNTDEYTPSQSSIDGGFTVTSGSRALRTSSSSFIQKEDQAYNRGIRRAALNNRRSKSVCVGREKRLPLQTPLTGNEANNQSDFVVDVGCSSASTNVPQSTLPSDIIHLHECSRPLPSLSHICYFMTLLYGSLQAEDLLRGNLVSRQVCALIAEQLFGMRRGQTSGDHQTILPSLFAVRKVDARSCRRDLLRYCMVKDIEEWE